MDLEVVHDPLNLPIKRLYRVSADSHVVKRYLDAFTDYHHPRGYRLRIIPYKGTQLIELSHRHALNVDMAESAMRAGGFKPRRQAFVNHNRILKDLRQKVYA